MGTLLVSGGDVLTPLELIEGGAVLARDGAIERVGPRSELADARADLEVDAAGLLICPGFVDLQVNGGGGVLLTEEPAVGTVERMAAAHVRFGTTAMLPTVVSADEATMARALQAVALAAERPGGTARILGAHLEGPFLSPERRGAHDARFLRAPDRALFGRLLRAGQGSLRLITLAPELPGALQLIAAARDASVAVSVGHTDASYEEAELAIEAGATLGTHVFNGMRGLHHRDPGVVGALLADERVAVSAIADGVHVHPAALALAARAKGAGRTALVTDALWSVGAEGGPFALQGRRVVARDGACYLEDGTLAGSALSMNRALRFMHREAGLPLLDCVRMATDTPARILGLAHEIGVLRPGARADIVVCDRDLRVCKVFVGGELAYEAAG